MLETIISCREKAREYAKEYELTAKRLIIFSCAMGVITALCALLCPKECSLFNISQRCELWIVLVLIITMKSHTPSEAALMSGGMMICAHFLAAIIKTPFEKAAPEQFIGWVPAILAAIPYAYFAKRFFGQGGKGKVWLLSLTSAVMLLYGFVHLKGLMIRPVYQLTAVLFCFGTAAAIAWGLIASQQTRVISAAVCGTALLAGVVVCFAHTYRHSCVLLLDSAKYPITDSWSVSAENERISEPAIERTNDDKAALEVIFYEEGENTYTLTDPDGEEYEIVVSYDGKDGVNVYDKR
ncbi:MAG: hypothetical protein IKR76_06000 [Ruminococcus sp.]|nr:hypothetical protein [Ruminococcus sp.]